jgi:toxin ParE1/3/4
VTSYRLAADADADLQNIYWFTHESWGENQAEIYINSLFATFDLLAQRPEMGRLRTELARDIRSFTHKRHVIYYTNLNAEIGIARVLHVSMDVEQTDIIGK